MLTQLLLKITGSNDQADTKKREELGKFAGWVGMLSNLFLFAIKLVAALLTKSVAIAADAVNNLSDSSSSLITLAGFKFSTKPADAKHPYGHARYEHISSLLVSCIIFVVGIQFFISSIQKTIEPIAVEFNWLTVFFLLLSIAIKVWQFLFNQSLSKKISSQALQATAIDSRNDVLITAVVLLSLLVQHYTFLQLDGPIGIAVSLFIILSGIQLLREALTPLLGEAPDQELVLQIQRRILSYPNVLGTHDLMVHNYGSGRCFASIHVEIPATQNFLVSHEMIDQIERDFLEDSNIHIVIHMDPVVTDSTFQNKMRKFTEEMVLAISQDFDVHDFRVVENGRHTNLVFDITVPPLFEMKDNSIRKKIQNKISEKNKNCFCVITIDRSYISTV